MQTYDGYTDYIVGTIKEKTPNFTIAFTITPYTYETVMSGLLSCFSQRDKKGLIISIGKHGKVQVKFGTGKQIYTIESLNAFLRYQKINEITFSYWSDAGWCDLCINGQLSNRIQFPRHAEIVLPGNTYYIGKYVDGDGFTVNSRRGFFHGCIHRLEYTPEYRPYKKVMDDHKRPFCAEAHINLYNEDAVKKDIYRPAYHLMPPGKWMNEPHAPFYYKGYYHIFYQANPHAPVWDNLCWGHLVSKDMVTWEYAGIALDPDKEIEDPGAGIGYSTESADEKKVSKIRDFLHNEIDPDGCWSGSACLNENGSPMIFYTAGNNNMVPNQSVALAVPEDLGDKKLKSWIKKGVILKQGLREGFLGEFRDPFVFRKGHRYFILVGSGDSENGGGNALVYETVDFKDFKSRGFITEYDFNKYPEVGHVWELPVLLPLRDENGEHAGDILLLCACQVEKECVETYYFLGSFDEKSGKFTKSHEEPELIDLGCGTFTGPSGFVTPDDRSVVFTIAQGKRGPSEYEAGWAHNGGMPVELSIVNGELSVKPVREIQNYFAEECDVKSRLLENYVVISTEGNHLSFSLGDDNGGYLIDYDRNSKKLIARDQESGKVISKYRGEIDDVCIGSEPIKAQILIDHSMIEIYLNNKKSITLRNYSYKNGYYLSIDSDKEYEVNVKNWKSCLNF